MATKITNFSETCYMRCEKVAHKALKWPFNFSAIPHGVLVGKDGKVINPDYHFYLDEPQFKKALEE